MIDDLKDAYRRCQYDDKELIGISKSIMPIGSALLRRLNKNQLMIIILEREKAFYVLREDYLKSIKADFKDSFEFAKINLGLTYTQEQLIDKNRSLAKQLRSAKEEISELTGTICSLRNNLERMKERRGFDG